MITKSFSEVFDLSLGRTPSRGNNLYWNGIHPWVSIADMSNVKYISQTKEKITDKALSDTHIPIVKKGTVIMSFKLTIGKVCITDCDIYTNEAIMAFTPKPQYKILPEFLFYYLMYYKWDKSNEVVLGCTLNKKSISQSLLSYPSSLAEQQRIVEILDAEFAKIDVLRANATKSLQAAKDLFQSALKQELQPKEGWVNDTISNISENLDYKRVPITKKDRDCGIYPYYGASGIVDYVSEYLFDEDLLLISEDGANLVARSTPIAFSISGKVWVNNHAHVLRFPSIELQRFVEYFFANYNLSSYITGTAQPKLTQKALNSIIIKYPPTLAEQTRIVSRLDQLNERCKTLQENYDRTITLCEDLKQALLRKAFNGEL